MAMDMGVGWEMRTGAKNQLLSSPLTIQSTLQMLTRLFFKTPRSKTAERKGTGKKY